MNTPIEIYNSSSSSSSGTSSSSSESSGSSSHSSSSSTIPRDNNKPSNAKKPHFVYMNQANAKDIDLSDIFEENEKNLDEGEVNALKDFDIEL